MIYLKIQLPQEIKKVAIEHRASEIDKNQLLLSIVISTTEQEGQYREREYRIHQNLAQQVRYRIIKLYS